MMLPRPSLLPLAVSAALFGAPLAAQEMPLLWAAADSGPVAAPTTAKGSSDVLRSERIFLDVPTLMEVAAQGKLGGPVAINLFGETYPIEIRRVDSVLGSRVLLGAVEGDANSEFAMSLDDTGIAAATMRIGEHEYELNYTGDGATHLVEERSAELHAEKHERCGIAPEHSIGEDIDRDDPVPAGRGTGPTILDVAAFYTPLARQNGGGTVSIENSIKLAMSRASEASRVSGLDQEFRLVYVAETNYTEVGNSTDLSRFRSSGDGHMDEVHAARNTYGADLMALIVDFATGYCGVAYLMSNVSTSFASSAFGVTVKGCLGTGTLVHEIGHNLGCNHDRDNAGGGGAYSYSYGHRCLGGRPVAYNYRSIMAYPPGKSVNQWSSPNLLASPNGCTLGANNDDNVRSINNVKSTVAAFRSTKLYEWTYFSGTGISGTNGQPLMIGKGHSNGTTVPIEATITNSPAGFPGFIVLGWSSINQPAYGGTVVPALDLLEPITGSAGPMVLDASFLQTLPPGTDVFLQAFFLDFGAPQNISASDGLCVTAL